MTTGERLAAYLAGDLGAEETAALEAELNRDQGLRARLEQLRWTDELLASLPDVVPSAEFSARLRDAVRAEASSLADDGVVVPASELVRRRNRRRQLIQRTGMGMAAAAAAVLGVVAIGNVGGGDDSMTTADSARDFDSASDAGGDTAAAGAADMAEMAAAPAPVLAEGGDYDQDSIGVLAEDGRLLLALDQAAADPAGMAAAARDLGLALDAASRFMTPTTDEAADDSGDTQAGPGDGEEPVPAQEALAAGVLDQITVANRCLPSIYTEDRELVPLWLESATFDDEPALVVVLASRGPDGELSRLEMYAFATIDCHVLFFQQADR